MNNPRYTGHQVWNRQRRDEVLIDVDDVALGHETRMRWNQETEWIWSPEAVHQPLISTETFQAVQAKTRDRQGQDERKARSSPRPYALRRLVSCGLCDRKMEGTWNGGRAHYRCRYPREYALANHIDHPRTVYVREDAILGSLDSWLASAFRPHNLDATLDALMSAQTARPLASTDADDARRILTNSEQRLARYRALLEAGADPQLVAQWISQVQAERSAAERRLQQARLQPEPAASKDELAALVRELGDMVTTISNAHPHDKHDLYTELGLRLTYNPHTKKVHVEARLSRPLYETKCRWGDLNPQGHKPTRPSTVRVYQFRHTDV